MKGVLIISERKNALTPYGIKVNVRLLEMGKKQTWLIEKIQELLPSRYIDSSFINRILTGQTNSPEVIASINEILCIDEVEQAESKHTT
ncbi:hypothetical protein RASY3_01455 [Ruminococcus albus SY3]|uniref:XRE family transcriptional regulator n=1 Tax=Ruminococcus albus SY3 TaxID=1341156 RepID=A0A011W2A1_RUMAL|nr:hypothetical protein [Ruminococcus albus]EXM40938.1 hypothetical protein RASY3_01455 [Ruminococcus albus SY3]